MILLRRYFTAAVLAALIPVAASAQARGTVTGTVVDAETQQPLVGVQVLIAGTQLGTLTSQQGRFVIPNVQAGPTPVVASIIGYAQGSQQVNVAAGESTDVLFRLTPSALALEGVVVTATGEVQRRREIGSSVANIEVANVELAPVTSMADLLQGRAAGVTVIQSSGTTGTGSRVRIRGNNSLSLDNSPLLVIDGVRVYDAEGSLGFGVGGQQPSRLNDLDPENIASIEILKGPAASALYGTAAANGVIQVTTKRGNAGQTRVRGWTEFGRIDRREEFPANFTILDADDPQFNCPLIYQNSGICTAEADVYTSNPLEDDATTPFDDGSRRVGGASVSGGSDAATFYISGEYEEEDGVYSRQNSLDRVSLQSNVTGALSSVLSVGANVGYVDSELELPNSDNALFGIIPMGLFGDADPAAIAARGGYESDPGYFRDWLTFQDISRLTGSTNLDFRPLSWLRLNGLAGIDRIQRKEVNRIPRESAYSSFGSVYTNGFIQDYEWDIATYTANTSASGVFALTPGLLSTTTLGTQYNRESTNRIYAFGAGLSPGTETSLAGATSDFEVAEFNIRDALFGVFGQQQFAWEDRIFLNAAVRGDRSSSFGTDYGWAYYPSVSGSWVISDESFFPDSNLLNSFRLRAAWGQSGLRPGTEDALLYFDPAITTLTSQDVPAFEIGGIGNPDLRPERSSEVEVGFEAGVLDSRLGFEATYYRKTSKDALVEVPVAPSTGGTDERWENLAEVRNSGMEFLVRGTAVDMQSFGLDFSLSASFLENELVDLGDDSSGEPLADIIVDTDGQRHVEGYPLGAYFMRPIIGFESGDGNVGFGEVEVGDDEVYLGTPFPTRDISLSGTGRILDYFTISTLFDYKGGHKLLNQSQAWRETFEENAERAYFATPEQQAAQVALLEESTYFGYVEDADFIKWRELSLTVGVPQQYTRMVGANGLRLTFAGRNLATWSDYSGPDPEVNAGGQDNFVTFDFGTLPPSRYLTIRVDADF